MTTIQSHSEIVIQRGRCSTHGVVQATKQVPKVRFPFLVFGVLRILANLRPFRCPACGMKVTKAR